MTSQKPGDQVVCLVKNGVVVAAYITTFDFEHIFEIIGLYDNGYLIYVPSTIILKSVIKIDKYNYKRYHLDKKFCDSEVCLIYDPDIARVYSVLDGMACSRCKEFFDKASPNQEDGTLICYLCTKYPYR